MPNSQIFNFYKKIFINLGCEAKISNLDLHAVIEEHIAKLQVPGQYVIVSFDSDENNEQVPLLNGLWTTIT